MSDTSSTKPFIPNLFERANEVMFDVVLSELGLLDQLKTVGDEIRGTCPICGGERSFSANPVKRVYNCFRCRKGGNVVKFVARFKNVVDDEAARWLVSLLPPAEEVTSEQTAAVESEMPALGLTVREVRLLQLMARACARYAGTIVSAIASERIVAAIAPEQFEAAAWGVVKAEIEKEFPDTVLPGAGE